MANLSSHAFRAAFNQQILTLYRQRCNITATLASRRRAGMSEIDRLAAEILSHEASTTKAVCAQLVVMWEHFNPEDPARFDFDGFCAAYQLVCKGAKNAVA